MHHTKKRRGRGVLARSAPVWLMLLLLAMPAACANPCGSLNALDWLVGAWETAGDEATREVWRRVSDATMEGHGATRDGGEWKVFESLRLLQMGGEIFFVAKTPGNPAPVAFKLAHCTARSARFDNPGHDFPTRIDYRRREDGGMSAEVRGPDGKGFTIDFQRAED